MNENDLKNLQIIWAMMLEYGQPTTGEWSYYGGWEHPLQFQWEKREQLMSKLRRHAATMGIDLVASGCPEYRQHAEFVGTGDPSKQVDSLIGTIVLRDGTRQMLAYPDYEDFVGAAFAELQRPEQNATLANALSKYFGE